MDGTPRGQAAPGCGLATKSPGCTLVSVQGPRFPASRTAPRREIYVSRNPAKMERVPLHAPLAAHMTPGRGQAAEALSDLAPHAPVRDACDARRSYLQEALCKPG